MPAVSTELIDRRFPVFPVISLKQAVARTYME
jgi:hypothetical protein